MTLAEREEYAVRRHDGNSACVKTCNRAAKYIAVGCLFFSEPFQGKDCAVKQHNVGTAFFALERLKVERLC